MKMSFRQGYLFEHEITDEIAPKYHQFIRRPVALDTIRKTLESNGYQSKEYFRRDVYLMLYNAMKYNPRYHHVHRSAKLVFNSTLPLFQVHISRESLDYTFFSSLISCPRKRFSHRLQREPVSPRSQPRRVMQHRSNGND
jgi:hypothetical protein